MSSLGLRRIPHSEPALTFFKSSLPVLIILTFASLSGLAVALTFVSVSEVLAPKAKHGKSNKIRATKNNFCVILCMAF